MSTRSSDLLNDDTIVAIITPPGEGGIAALRLAGTRCLSYVQKHFVTGTKPLTHFKPFLMRVGQFVGRDGSVIDEVTAVFMPAGKSYTGLDQVEIFCHGGRLVATTILNELIAAGARAAEPGEFTKLAFLSGRIDLTRAEAVAGIISANTDRSYHAAKEHLLGAYAGFVEQLRDQIVGVMAEVEASIDFPEEETAPADSHRLIQSLNEITDDITELADTYRGGRIIKEGFTVAIAGRPNAGKSSLFNLLLRQERALVTPTAGTTRDYLSEWIDLEGFAVQLIDTAGLRRGGGAVERAGQQRATDVLQKADLVLWLFDLAEPKWEQMLAEDRRRLPIDKTLVLANKVDLVHQYQSLLRSKKGLIALSCLTGKGIKQLKIALVARINDKMPDLTAGVVVTSARHQQKLLATLKCLRRARSKMKRHESPELVAFELRQTVSAIDEITGRVYTEEILGRIFSTFCIGK